MSLLSSAWRVNRTSSGLSSAESVWVKVEGGRVWICVTYGVEHETAVSVESDLPFVLMGFVLFLGRLIVRVDVEEPGPGITFESKGGNEGSGGDACQIYARA